MKEGSHVDRKELIPLFAKHTGLTRKRVGEVRDVFQNMAFNIFMKKDISSSEGI